MIKVASLMRLSKLSQAFWKFNSSVGTAGKEIQKIKIFRNFRKSQTYEMTQNMLYARAQSLPSTFHFSMFRIIHMTVLD